jgi:RNA polymerase sigma factor (sigma-70 family)
LVTGVVADADPAPEEDPALVELVPMLRRVVGARVKDQHTIDDLVQEALVRVVAARTRLAPDKLAQYAAVTARNLVATMAEKNDRARDRSHLLVDDDEPEPPVQRLLRVEDRSLLVEALAQLPAADRDLLLAHEVEGQDTSTMAADRGSTPGAVAARLNRARANLRVEYLVVEEGVDLPSDRCRAVLRALSLGDRRRQAELDVDRHVIGCPACAQVRARLFERRSDQGASGAIRVPVVRDADVVQARQRGREVAAQVGFAGTDLTLIATAISEISRNIVKFADRGEVVITPMTGGPPGARRGIHVVARDAGPGIEDPARAMEDGYSTYHGLGLGLPGAKRLMDHFDLVSSPGEGTTVTMEKWLR